MNHLRITNEYIDFSQMHGINKEITIYYLTDKIVISNRIDLKAASAHVVTLDDNFMLHNAVYAQSFKAFGITDSTSFFHRNGTFYQTQDEA